MLKEKGCHLYLWSTVGAEYARLTAQCHRLTEFFEGFSAKPDIVIDDMPGTDLNPFVFNPRDEPSWESLAAKIISKHIDRDDPRRVESLCNGRIPLAPWFIYAPGS
ncbi:MAG: hypothetical protein JWR26_1545 [Pedosphaera sp.]|nr:hypothetical protein [Pedosphaera sp.]